MAATLLPPPEGRTPLDSPSLLADANNKKATGISGGFLLSLFLVQGAALWPPESLGGSTADHIRPAGAALFFSAIKKPRIVCEAIRGKKISGTVLLSHSQIYSTIAAGVLNHRVREGNGCFNSAMSTGKTKQ